MSYPIVYAQNIIIGTPYIDIGGDCVVKSLGKNSLNCLLKFHLRGWLSSEEFKVEGDVINRSLPKKDQHLFKIHGNWNKKISISKYENGKVDKKSEIVVF